MCKAGGSGGALFQLRLVSSVPVPTGLPFLPVLVYQHPRQPRSRQRCFQLGKTAHHARKRLFRDRFLLRTELAVWRRPDQTLSIPIRSLLY